MSDIYTINREYSIVRTSSIARAPGHGTVRTCDVIIVRADRFAALMRSRSLNFCFIHFSKCLLLLSLLLALKSIKKKCFHACHHLQIWGKIWSLLHKNKQTEMQTAAKSIFIFLNILQNLIGSTGNEIKYSTIDIWVYVKIIALDKLFLIVVVVVVVVYVLPTSPKLHQFCSLMFFTSCMWPNSSSGSPSSETRSLTLCRRSFRLSLELLFCCLGHSWSIFSSPLQQDFSWHPPPQQFEFDWFTSRASMLSDTELTLGGGFSRAFLMPSTIVSSYREIRCRRPFAEARTGLSGWWLWHQQIIAL